MLPLSLSLSLSSLPYPQCWKCQAWVAFRDFLAALDAWIDTAESSGNTLTFNSHPRFANVAMSQAGQCDLDVDLERQHPTPTVGHEPQWGAPSKTVENGQITEGHKDDGRTGASRDEQVPRRHADLPQAASADGAKSADAAELPPQHSRKYRAKRELRRITLHFTPSWFSVNMGTGISSILLHQLPYQFRGLGIISNVIFALNVLLFCIFLGLSVARYTIWPTMGPTMLFHPTQSLFLGTLAMGFATIVNMCALSAAPAWGPRFALFTWALWWIDAALSIVICIGLPFLQFTRHNQSLDKVTGVWFLPVVSTIVAAASGGIVAEILPPAHARLTLVVSWILWGTGFPLAILLMALYYGRLSIYKIPPASLIISAFLPLGPCGQGAFGLLQMSYALKRIMRKDGHALVAGETMDEAQLFASAIYASTIPVALVIWGLGLVWLAIAIGFLIDLALVSRLTFNLGWWGFTFPLGVFCTATTQLGKELDSGAFKVIGTVLSLVEVALWLYIAVRTLIGAASGKLFFSPCLAEQGGDPPKYIAPARKYEYEPRQTLPVGGSSRERARKALGRIARSASPRSRSRGRSSA